LPLSIKRRKDKTMDEKQLRAMVDLNMPMTCAQVAMHLNVGRQSVWRWIKLGYLKAINLGEHRKNQPGSKPTLRVRPCDLAEFLEGPKPGKEAPRKGLRKY
jgi:hypothetical protein